MVLQQFLLLVTKTGLWMNLQVRYQGRWNTVENDLSHL